MPIFTLNCRGRLLILDEPKVMGILNITPDSFYKESRMDSDSAVLNKAEQMIREGACFLDVGGQSTRPGSKTISVEEELKRVIPAVKKINHTFPDIIISVDTFQSKVATEAFAAGASIINDVSTGEADENMINTIASLNVPYVCMHKKGTPENMQNDPAYENVTKEILDYFIHKLGVLDKAGIKDVIVDPGFGFGKTISHNFELLKHLDLFKILEKPVLVGLSRKSSIYKTLKISIEEALNGTTVLNTVALIKGANILRVHDVKEASEAIKLVNQIQ